MLQHIRHIQPETITIQHLRRRAIVYCRSAVFSQDAIQRQMAQQDVALRWGWPAEAIEIICDNAAGGLNANRTGYRRLIQMIEAEQVGLVLVADPSRLSRSHVELRHFLDVCQSTDTLLAVNGAIWPSHEHERCQQLIERLAEFEARRWARMRRRRQRPVANTALTHNRP